MAASSIRGADDSKSAVAPRPRSKVTAQQKMDLVVDDLNALKNKRKALAEVKDDLKRDLAALTAGPIKPKEATVGQLVNDLVPNWTDLHLLLGERQMFVRDLHVIFNSTLLSIDESERIIADVQLLLKGAGMGEAELQPLAGDLRLLVKELRPTPAQ